LNDENQNKSQIECIKIWKKIVNLKNKIHIFSPFKNNHISCMPVAHTCNPRYLGGWDWEDHGSMPVQANSSQDSISKNNQSKMDSGSGGRVPVL
jgi:hypothetical protein